jgi:class 3 adenylate cyclase
LATASTVPVTGTQTVPSSGPLAERRVCSVLFCDVVGFTPLSESRDPEAVRELLTKYFTAARTVIGRYGGVVEKFIGDAVMAVWGTPTATEEDAERAVRGALDLVATVGALGADANLPGLAARAGVVTGEVAVTLGATHEGMVARRRGEHRRPGPGHRRTGTGADRRGDLPPGGERDRVRRGRVAPAQGQG